MNLKDNAAWRYSPLSFLALLLGFILTWAGWQYTAARLDRSDYEQFQLHANDAREAVRQRINTNLEILRGGLGLFAASEGVTRDEWKRYVGALDLQRYPGIQGMGFIRYLAASDKKKFELEMRSLASESSSGLGIFPPGERDVYYPVEYFEAIEPGLKILGLDHGAYSVGRGALERARDSGQPTASARLVSLIDQANGARFMIVLPVYRKGMPHNTVAERRSALFGFIYARFRMEDLLGDAVGATLRQELYFNVFDGGYAGSAVSSQAERPLYEFRAASALIEPPRFKSVSRLEVAGRDWIIQFTTRPDSPLAMRGYMPWLVLAGGILLSLALYTIVLILSSERRRVAKEIKRQKSLTSQVLDALPINIFLKDKGGHFVLINEQCARLLAVVKEEAIGKSDFDLFPPDIAQGLRAYDEEVRAANGLVMREERLISEGREMFTLAGKVMIDQADGEAPLLLGFSLDITERKKMERSLCESEGRFRGILDNSTAVIYIKDMEGRYLLVNRQYEKLFHVHNAEVAGKTDHDLFTAEVADAYRANDRAVLAGGKTIEFEEQAPHDDGMHTYISIKFPLFDASGEAFALCGMSTDITERLRLEREAAEARDARLSRALTNAVGEGLIGVDRSRRVTFVNPKAVELLGWPEAEVLKKNLVDVTRCSTEDGRPVTDEMCPMGDVLTEGETFQSDDWRFMRANGEPLPVSLVIAPIFEHEEIIGAVLSFQDISRRKATEAALVAAERLQKAFLDNLPELAWFKDRDSRYLMVNEACSKACGVPLAEIPGKTDFDLWPLDIAERYRADDRLVMESGEHKRVEEPFQGKDGHRLWIETIKSPIRDGSGQVVGTVGTARDVSARKRAEEELKRYVFELARINAELDEFTYVASHDLQEPLRKLIAFSDWLKRDMGVDLPSRAMKDVEFITDAANRMQSLVQDLLKLSRTGKTSMVREWIELDAVVGEALNTLALRIQEAGAEIVCDPLPQVWGDSTLLAQLYQNLVGNALKFVDHGPPSIRLTAEQIDGEWVLGVKDNGIGIKPEYASQIFQPFKRLHSRAEYEGSGIGLAVCRKVIERHRGRIWVESAEGQGAHFKFVLQAGEKLSQ